MTLRNSVRFALFVTACVLAAGCSRTSTLEPMFPSTDAVVFLGKFGDHVGWQAFGGSKLDALSLERIVGHAGAPTMSLKISVPASGSWAGGALTTPRLRNLSGYNAISFWARASQPVVLDHVGFGNDNTGRSKYSAEITNITLGTDWSQYFIAIPNPARLTAEGGMFYVSENFKSSGAFAFWIDDIQFVNVATISNPRPVLTTQSVDGIAGSPLDLSNATRTVFKVGAADQAVTHMPGYFDYVSSDAAVATPIPGGVQVVGAGTANITAKLAGVSAAGTVTVKATLPPATAAPAPTLPATSVISLFSDAYPGVPVDSWSANWNQPGGVVRVADVLIAGNPTKRYMNLTYAGVTFQTHPIDATAMTAFHLDVWAPAGATFLVKLVEFTSEGSLSSSSELTFNATSTPAFTSGAWVPLDIPLADFTTLATRSHLAQLVISSPDAKIVYVDNLYFHQ